MASVARGNLTQNSLIMILAQMAIKALAFFLPFTLLAYLGLTNSAHMVLRLPL
jgi:hypothetical protein